VVSNDRVQKKGCNIGACGFIAKRRMRHIWVFMKQRSRKDPTGCAEWGESSRFSISNFRSKIFENTKEETGENGSASNALYRQTQFNMLPDYFLPISTMSLRLQNHTLPFSA
jgi:hypothetical protein